MMTRKGFTLVEIAMVVAIVAIIFGVALPSSGTKASLQGDLAGQNFEADISFARSYSIAHPDDPAVIKVDQANNKYWLAAQSAPDTPLTHPLTHQPYVIQYGANGIKGFEQVQIAAFDFGGDSLLKVDSTGSLDQATQAVFQLSSGNSKYEVDVSTVAAQATVQKGFVTDLGVAN